MPSLRKHGRPPFTIAVLHGGPGAPGAVSLLAAELADTSGVLEPLQTADTIAGQVTELSDVLAAEGNGPITLIGSSWGAWLGFLTAARHPALVKKLILVGSPPYEDWFSRDITAARLRRLPEAGRSEAEALLKFLGDASVKESKDDALARIGVLFTQADSVDPITLDMGVRGASFRIHSQVWKEATRLRARGEMAAVGHHIRCPVIAIHGDRDPHPAEGVEGPLTANVRDFRFFLLKDCGHFPWIERSARDAFFARIRAEL